MEINDDPTLRSVLREWRVPNAPATVEQRVLLKTRPWWHILISGRIRIPVPLAVAGALAIIFLTSVVMAVLLAGWSIPTAGQQNVPSRPTATISGKISFEGTPPPNDKVQMASDPYCQRQAADYPTVETTKVSDGGLENVIVYVSNGLPSGVSYATPTTPIELDQLNCHYIPHVLTMMTQQRLTIKNSDMTLNNVHAWSEKNPQFNIGQPVKGMVNETKFAYPEMPLVIRDDVHRWKSAFVGVFDHPFHTVSKSGGLFELKLPPGYYEIAAWHEKYGKKTMMVGVLDNERRVINITFAPNDR